MEDSQLQQRSEWRPPLGSGARQRVRQAPYQSEMVWRYGLNMLSVRSFQQSPPQLTLASKLALEQLNESGIAVAAIDDLLSEPGLFEELQERARLIEDEQLDKVSAARAVVDVTNAPGYEKPFVVELLDRRRPVIHPRDILGRIALDSQLRGISDSYFGLRTRISDVNLWRTLKTRRAPSSSQLWHRDIREDRYVLKMFIYLEDVDESSGPFMYLARTHPKGSNSRMRLPGQTRDEAPRAPADAPDRAGYAADVVTVTGPAGTVIFADTLGYHRGGYAAGRDRFAYQVRYASRAADRHRMLGCPAGIAPQDYSSDFAYDDEVPAAGWLQPHGLRE